jgi:hypothetical protein
MPRDFPFESARPGNWPVQTSHPIRKPRRRAHRAHRPRVLAFEDRLLPSGILVVGAGAGAPPEVRVYSALTGAELFHFLAYNPQFRGGVSVAVGDLNGDGGQEIVTAPGAGMRPEVKVFSGTTGAELGEFLAAPAAYSGGLTVAVGDVTGSGHDQIVTADERGSSLVSVFDGAGARRVSSFMAYSSSYHGGVNVAVGDLSRVGHDDIVTAPRSGPPKIKVFDGVSHAVRAEFLAYDDTANRGVDVAIANIAGNDTLDIVTATPDDSPASKGAASIKVFSGLSDQEQAHFQVPGRLYARGVRVAAIDTSGDHIDDLAVAADGGGAVTVLDTSLLAAQELLPPTNLGGSLPPIPTGVGDLTPPVLYTVSGGPSRGAFAATSSTTESTPGALAALASPADAPTLTPIERLAYYDPDSGQFVPVTPDDPRLVDKDVYVLVHGWEPGYLNWVNAAAAEGQVLEWWQTFPGQPGYNPAISGGLGPASPWLLEGHTEDGITVSSTGLVQDILASDPNAAVLAYSWIDDSATAVSKYTGIPEDAYLSEAYTTLNGERLAVALEEVLGSEAQFQGKLQLIGHSHGSKVATVAAVALSEASSPITVNQLTILDSPESSDTDLGYLLAEEGASNNNWYFLQELNIDRQNPSATFVDNYISYFDEPYDTILYPGSNPDLGQVVDVSLDAEPYSFTDPSGQHNYAAYWYAGSAESSLTYGNEVGRKWSPLLSENSGPNQPPQDLSPSYEQSWNAFDYSQANQFELNPYTPSSLSPVFNPVTLPAQNGAGILVTNSGDGASVTLTQQNGTMQSYTASFATAGSLHGIRGLTFNYQFENPAPGDVLTISVDGNLAFVMDSSVAQSESAPGTITIGDPIGGLSHSITVTLTSTQPNSTSAVIVSNLEQFADG